MPTRRDVLPVAIVRPRATAAVEPASRIGFCGTPVEGNGTQVGFGLG